jgi:hypothetical protein
LSRKTTPVSEPECAMRERCDEGKECSGRRKFRVEMQLEWLFLFVQKGGKCRLRNNTNLTLLFDVTGTKHNIELKSADKCQLSGDVNVANPKR